mgnify:CR=1 FL=1
MARDARGSLPPSQEESEFPSDYLRSTALARWYYPPASRLLRLAPKSAVRKERELALILGTLLSTSLVVDTSVANMNSRELVEELFQLDKDIRWVGVVDQQGHILENSQRPGVKSLADPATDELTLREFPTIMGLLWGRLVGQSGELNSVIVSYTRVHIMAFYVGDFLVVLSFEPRGMSSVPGKLQTKYGALSGSPSNQDASAD